jgi:hypothetical protein
MSKNKAIKTCGECKWFVLNSEGQCRSIDVEENANNDCCSFFEPKVITNGDKIRQMSDEELAMIFVCKMDSGVFYSHFTGGFYASQEKAIAATVEELKKEYKK